MPIAKPPRMPKHQRETPPSAPAPNAVALDRALASKLALVSKIRQPGADKALLTITAAGRNVICLMAAAGNDQATIAARLGISLSTLRDIVRRDDAVEAAFAAGKGMLADELTHLLLSQARAGNTVAAIYLSKARLGWRDGGHDSSDAPRANITINLPSALEPEAYLKTIAAVGRFGPPQTTIIDQSPKPAPAVDADGEPELPHIPFQRRTTR